MLNENLLPIVIAGLINGSFVVPIKYVKNLSSEKIWFYHSIVGCGIIPWLMFLFLPSGIIRNYTLLSASMWLYIILGGFVFGLGQLCFSYAIEKIGMALSFAINLGIAVILGSMYVVLQESNSFTLQNVFVSLSVLLIAVSLIFYYFSSNENYDQYVQTKSGYRMGWILALLAGVASGIQNIIFVLVGFHISPQFAEINSYWVWPPFLTVAAVAMLFGFLYKIKSKREKIPMLDTRNFVLIGMMGLFFTGSLVLYSIGMSNLPHGQKMLGWPTLMILIILTSQFWGWIFKETKNANKLYRSIRVCKSFCVTSHSGFTQLHDH